MLLAEIQQTLQTPAESDADIDGHYRQLIPFGSCSIDLRSRTVISNGRHIRLTKGQYELLVALAHGEGQVLPFKLGHVPLLLQLKTTRIDRWHRSQ
jgi:DNA-binding response OmpR family regulator